MTPDRFIPVAEDTGLVVELGTDVLRLAMTEAVRWRHAVAQPVAVAVNLSRRQLRDEGLVEFVGSTLEKTGLEPGALIIELTEAVVMGNEYGEQGRIEALRRLGLRVAIDDFGTGLSSVDYLRRFPVDLLKIDNRFVRGIANGGRDADLARAMLAMARALGARAIAEGIENEEQLRLLREFGCELAQGYYFCRPLPPTEFLRWLGEGNGQVRS